MQTAKETNRKEEKNKLCLNIFPIETSWMDARKESNGCIKMTCNSANSKGNVENARLVMRDGPLPHPLPFHLFYSFQSFHKTIHHWFF